MPHQHYTRIETVEGRHKDAKWILALLVDTLKNEGKMSEQTSDVFHTQIDRIQDNPFSLVTDLENRTIFLEREVDGKIKKYSAEIKITELS